MKDLGQALNLISHLWSGNGLVKIEPSFQDSIDKLLPSCIGRSSSQRLFPPSLGEDQHFGRISLQTKLKIQLHPPYFGEVVAFRIEKEVVEEADHCFNGG